MKAKLVGLVAFLIMAGSIQSQDTLSISGDSIKVKSGRNSFDYGSIIIEVGGGAASYWTYTYSQGVVNGEEVILEEEGRSSSITFPITVEFGFKKKYGFGLRFAYQKFSEGADSITGIRPSQRTIDIAIVNNFHFVKRPNFDMPLSLIWGYSNLEVIFNDPLKKEGSDHGFSGGLLLTPRYYFSDNLGVYVSVGILNYVFPSIAYSNSVSEDLNENGGWSIWKGASSIGGGAGLVFQF